MFFDPWNPSSAEVRDWAYTANAIEPCQDWDLALSRARYERDYIEFASDVRCPNRMYFMRIIYLIIGDAVRSKFTTLPASLVHGFLDLAHESKHPDIHLWRERSLALLKHPEDFNYNAWCAGGLANETAT